ncbi:MAG: transposase, partial [Parachlamydiaceae bacterium]
ERNWSEYNKQLVQRGSLTFLIDPKMIKELKVSTTKAKAKAGRPQEFLNRLIELLAIIKVHFKMAYRFLEGFAKSYHKWQWLNV